MSDIPHPTEQTASPAGQIGQTEQVEQTAQAASFHRLLVELAGSYDGPTEQREAPYGVVGTGEGTLAAAIAASLVPATLGSGTQFVLSSPDSGARASDYAAVAEVAGAAVRRISTGGDAAEVDQLIPSGVLSTYYGAQAVAYATGHKAEASAADALIAALATSCAGKDVAGNPALELAWKLRYRTPLLLADEGAEALVTAWQQVLARVGKMYSQPILGDPLATVTGMFEARHEDGDQKVAVILGDLSPRLDICREVLETRTDEVIHLPYAGAGEGLEGNLYAPTLALWYLGVWTAYHLAALEQQSPADAPTLTEAQKVLAGG